MLQCGKLSFVLRACIDVEALDRMTLGKWGFFGNEIALVNVFLFGF